MEQVEVELGGGRYRLVNQLGEGGMAVVYRARDERLGVDRAVKLLKSDVASKKSVLRRFEAEATTMARLHHPNVVTVHDVVVDPDRVFMVMELVDGGSLVDWLDANGPMPPRLAASVAVHMLAGLAAAHDAGVVHRDIKPHNVLLSREGTPKIGDFGIAHLENQEHSYTRTGSVMGTWAYMPPEQRSSAKAVDPRADLYSVGATLYALVANTEPFDLYVTEGHEEMFEGLPEHLVAVIKKACRYRPDDRFADASEMASALHGILPDLPPIPAGTRPLGSTTVTLDTAAALASLHSDANSDTGFHLMDSQSILLEPSPHAASATTTSDWRLGMALVGGGVAALVLGGIALGAVAWTVTQQPEELAVAPEPTPVAAPLPAPEPVVAPEPTPEPVIPEPVVEVEPEPVSPKIRPTPRVTTAPKPPVVAPKPPPEPVAVASGSVKVNSIPWSTVYIDGTKVKTTPITGHSLPVGVHEVRLVAGDGTEKVRSLTVAAGEQAFFCWKFAAETDC